MKLKTVIQKSFKYYPTLYAGSRTKVLCQLLLTNGNGYAWKNGEMNFGEMNFGKCKQQIFTVNDAVLSYIKSKKDKSQIHFDHSMILNQMTYSYSFYPMSHGFFLADKLPTDITDEYLSAVAQILLKVIFFRSRKNRISYWSKSKNKRVFEGGDDYGQDNPAMALSCIARYNEKFKDRESWTNLISHPQILFGKKYEGVKYFDINKVRVKQLLSLCIRFEQYNSKDCLIKDPYIGLTAEQYLNYMQIDSSCMNSVDITDPMQILADLVHQKWVDDRDMLLKINGDNN